MAHLFLINPKTHELIRCEFTQNRSVQLWYPLERSSSSRLGEAYLDSDEEHDVYRKGRYSRSHSPAGVQRPGKAFGLLLYGGLSLRAYAAGNEGIISHSDEIGPYSHRSSSADQFWEAMVERGLAENVDVSVHTTDERETEYEPPDECDYTGDDECTNVIRTSTATIEYEVETEMDVEMQIMDADTFAEQGLILDAYSIRRVPELPDIPPEILLGLDLEESDFMAVKAVFDRLKAYDVPPEYSAPLFYSLDDQIREELLKTRSFKAPILANSSRNRARVNSASKELDEAWEDYFGDLQDMP